MANYNQCMKGLEEELRLLPKDVILHTEQIVEWIEDEQNIEAVCHNMAQYRVFYQKYIITLLEENIRDEHNIEIMLAACGLLKGYEEEASLEERRNKYANEAHKKNKYVSDAWVKSPENASHNSYQRERLIKEELLMSVSSKINKETGLLGLADKVIDKFDGVVPTAPSLPSPKYTKATERHTNTPITPDEIIDSNMTNTRCSVVAKVRVKGDKEGVWKNSLDDVKVGDKIEYVITYSNINGKSKDITFRDDLPDNLQSVVGMTRLVESDQQIGIVVGQDTFIGNGINVSSCRPDTDISLCYEAEAIADETSDELRLNKIAIKYGWGPMRPIYTNGVPIDCAIFNSIVDNPLMGDERNFVRVTEKGKGKIYSSEIKLEANKEYEVYIYYHNNASISYNDKKRGYNSVATDTRISSTFPLELKANERATVSGVISWSTLADRLNIQNVWSEAFIIASEDMTLHYVTASAKIYNEGKKSGSILSANLFSEKGTFIGLDDLNGIIVGGAKFGLGHVVYTIQTHAINIE